MTGIQALERIAPTQPMKPGRVERREFEYKRHGTQCLIGNFEVATGEVIAPTVQPTRTEEDFARHIAADGRHRPGGGMDLRVRQPDDPLPRSRWSAYVAEACGVTEDLGGRGRAGC